MMFSFGGGMYANTGNEATFAVKAFSFCSPIRYSAELLLRAILKEKRGKDVVLQEFGYTWGEDACFAFLGLFILVTLIAGWGVMHFMYRKV